MKTTPPFEHQHGLLVGRDAEVELLHSAYQRVAAESPLQQSSSSSSSLCEAVLLHGDSGTGKTALVRHAFQRQIDDGTMMSGKFDVIHAHVRHHRQPYSAIVDALTMLCHSETWNVVGNLDEFQSHLRERFSSSDVAILSKLIPSIADELQQAIISPVVVVSNDDSNEDTDAAAAAAAAAAFEPSSNDSAFAFARFSELVRLFLYSVARFMSSPLILFLDDVQAADEESLSLISSLTAHHSECCNLLLILAHRELLIQHPHQHQQPVAKKSFLSNTSTFRVTDIKIGILKEESLNKLICRLLRMDEEDTMPLSRLVTERVGGNIYFALQFLDMLRHQALLAYSLEHCTWEWDLEKIRADTMASDNMAQLLSSKINQLPKRVQSVLQLAACLGFHFDIEFLERVVVNEWSLEDNDDDGDGSASTTSASSEKNLSPPTIIAHPINKDGTCNTEEDAMLPTKNIRKKKSNSFSRSILAALDGILIDRAGGTKYKFIHDRVMQAVYETIPAGREKDMLHWRIGNVLWTELQQQKQQQQQQQQQQSLAKVHDDWLWFAAADQLNRGSDHGLMNTDGVNRLDLARLNLEAGNAALGKAAFAHAAGFFEKGVKMMEGMWHVEYSLCLELHTLSAEAEYAASNFDKCDQRIGEILAHGHCLEDKLRAYLVRVQSQGVRGNIVKAMDESVAVLRMLDERVPHRPNILQILYEIVKTKRLLSKRSIAFADFLSLPDMTSPLKIWSIQFLLNAALFSWYAGQHELLAVSVYRMMQLTVLHGISAHSPFVLAAYGFFLGVLNDPESAYEVGQVALELAKRPHTMICYASTIATVSACTYHLKHPMTRVLDQCMTGYNIGIKSGEIKGAGLCLGAYGLMGILLGKNLTVVNEEMEGFRQAYRDEMERHCEMICLLPWYQFALNITEQSQDPLKLTGDSMCEETYLKEVKRGGNEVAILQLLFARMMLLFVLGDYEAANVEVGMLGVKIVSRGTHFSIPFMLMYAALVLIAMARRRQTPHHQRKKYWRRAKVYQRLMEKFAKAGNLNLPPLLELVNAEILTLWSSRGCRPHHHRGQNNNNNNNNTDDNDEVKEAYESAIRMASRSGLSVVEAIGNERAGEYMQSIDDTFWAETYLSRAFLLYDEWGATTKTKQMMEKHAFLMTPPSSDSRDGGRRNSSVTMRKRYNYTESRNNDNDRLNIRFG